MVLYLLALLFVIVAYLEMNKQEVKQLTELHSRLDVLAERVARVQQGLERRELEQGEEESNQ